MNPNIILQLLQGAFMTIKVCSLSVVMGSMGGILMGIATSHKVNVPIINYIIKGYVAVIRGTPLFIQLLIIYFAMPEVTGMDISPFTAGVFALGLNSAAYISEIIRGGINSLPGGQWESSYCLGYSTPQTLLYIILPQTFRNVFPAMTNEFISLVKESSILMILGVQELTKMSKNIVARDLNPFEIYLLTALIYFLMTTTISMISSKIERKSHV